MKIFTTLDLEWGFHKKHQSAHNGYYEFLIKPLGLQNAPEYISEGNGQRISSFITQNLSSIYGRRYIVFNVTHRTLKSPHTSFPNSCKCQLEDVTRICWYSVLALEVCVRACVRTCIYMCCEIKERNKKVQTFSINRTTSKTKLSLYFAIRNKNLLPSLIQPNL